MKFTLEIDCSNAAFTDDGESCEHEVARILDDLSHRIYRGERFDCVVLRDINGNKVGEARFTEELI